MRILIFSWRDIKNPKSGGAEILTQELARRWVEKAHRVTMVSARFPGSKASETIDGIKIFRPAKFDRYSPFQYLSYLFKTAKFYKQNLAGKYDLIIDQVHGLPFFAPFYVREKVVLFPLEVAKEIWRHEIPFPFWPFGYFLEFFYIKLFRNHPFWAISDSTAQDLKNLGVKNVKIITPGVSFKPHEKVSQKSKDPMIVSLGRLTPMKRIEQTLEAFGQVSKRFPKARLLIIGRGKKNYVKKLKKKSGKGIDFTGFVSENQKQKLLSKAWVLVSTSLREGWGLNVIEAAACGTLAVVYDAPGLRDSVKNKKTGVICQENSPQELAKEVIKVLADEKLRKKLSQNALNYSQNFSWDKAAEEGLAILKKIISR